MRSQPSTEAVEFTAVLARRVGEPVSLAAFEISPARRNDAALRNSSGRAIRTPFGLRSSRGGGGSRPPFAAILWQQGVLRHSHEDIVESALRYWRAVLTVMGDGPYFFGDEPTGIDAVVFGALATSVLTPIESPIRDFLRSQPVLVSYAERMRARFFPELAVALSRGCCLSASYFPVNLLMSSD